MYLDNMISILFYKPSKERTVFKYMKNNVN